MEKRRLSKRRVMNGTIRKTAGGLEKRDITVRRSKDRQGSRLFVSRRKSNAGKKNAWSKAFVRARKALGIEGFVAPRKSGGTKEQRDLYKKTLELF